MNNRIATILSVVFHPLIITTYLFAILFLLAPDLVGVSALELPALGSLLLLLFLNTFVAPSVVIYYMYRLGVIRSLHVDSLQERRLPYLASIIIYAAATYLFRWQLRPIGELAPQIATLLGSATVTLLTVASVSLFWKISAHATGIGGAAGVLIALLVRYDEQELLTALMGTILLAGFLVSARLQLHAHTLAQVFTGFVAGVAIGILTVYQFF
ncbi:hypothetical protein DYBT9275_04236 [Dyadobacter sp. CECT 9275]|uniref:PAP2 superfamily protein n=1 Tax=Dyadobacter helix TaxID=2822344 RepID=A0A916JEV7_9BACT|nr:hypothetical protein [Dyadobacter sp. CECT 9275]CAG5008297.1 hypothetical protein DYBT9275_04236 [Dyadobacter sp. CECT 9275]